MRGGRKKRYLCRSFVTATYLIANPTSIPRAKLALARHHEAETAAPRSQFALWLRDFVVYVIQVHARFFLSNEETSSIAGEGTSTAALIRQ